MSALAHLLTKLRQTLDRPDTVLLIGSGVSLWSGLPTWRGLLTQLADFLETNGRDPKPVREELERGDLLLAASYAVHQLDFRDLGAVIRKALKHPHAVPSELHRLIATLGPSCFVTTNYDHLLETAIRHFGARGEPLIVTNRQPTEIADIIPGSARNFVFKYHGDLNDGSSIVLSRDQYRRIQHDYPDTMRAFSTLLATRPVVMIGFGLRDPDYLNVQDELVSAFHGQAGEYFAIQPDFDDTRADYWRREYRTEIITYQTKTRSDGSLDHAELLALIKALQPAASVPAVLAAPPPTTADRVLLFARLGAAMSRLRPPAVGTQLPLTVYSPSNIRSVFRLNDYGSLEELLEQAPESILLCGRPGAGKSFALRSYVARLGEVLTNKCLSEADEALSFHVPLFANLALYAGDGAVWGVVGIEVA
jgi:hypothetical protein